MTEQVTIPYIGGHGRSGSRAVAYPWARSKESPAAVGGRCMRRLSPSQASRAWSLQLCSYGFLLGFARLSCLRYEDVVNHLTPYLTETLIRVGFDDEASGLPAVRERQIPLSVAIRCLITRPGFEQVT
jgi:hypothetical protein